MPKKIKKFREHYGDEEEGRRIREQRKQMRSSDRTLLRNVVKTGDWSDFEDDLDEEQSGDYRW